MKVAEEKRSIIGRGREKTVAGRSAIDRIVGTGALLKRFSALLDVFVSGVKVTLSCFRKGGYEQCLGPREGCGEGGFPQPVVLYGGRGYL